MKKLLSVILAVLMLFSAVSVVAFAENEDTEYYRISFVDYDGTTIKSVSAERGAVIVAPSNPTRENTEEYEYVFKGWSPDGGQTLYHETTIPRANGDVIYVACYAENEIVEGQTFWSFIASIFRRINMIFEYFYDIFTRGLDSIGG